jgi:hypothetical protein
MHAIHLKHVGIPAGLRATHVRIPAGIHATPKLADYPLARNILVEIHAIPAKLAGAIQLARDIIPAGIHAKPAKPALHVCAVSNGGAILVNFAR